jgi:hypothetical protein
MTSLRLVLIGQTRTPNKPVTSCDEKVKMSRLLPRYSSAQRLIIRSAWAARAGQPSSTPQLRRNYASASPISKFDWEDPLAAKNLLTEDELAISETAERYCQDQLLPRVLRMTLAIVVTYPRRHC